MAIRDILLLGNPLLYERCSPISVEEVPGLQPVIRDLHDTLSEFRSRTGTGRAIAAPQIGLKKRLVYMHVGEPVVFMNPALDNLSSDIFELWDDCMSFPDLLVRVRRHTRCRIVYRDVNWMECSRDLQGDLSELLQHECDHLDGILAVSRAVGPTAFALRSQRHRLPAKEK